MRPLDHEGLRGDELEARVLVRGTVYWTSDESERNWLVTFDAKYQMGKP